MRSPFSGGVQSGDTRLRAGNILILRENIRILPEDRTSVSYEFLAQLVGEYLLTASPGVDTSAALSIMPVSRSRSLLINHAHVFTMHVFL